MRLREGMRYHYLRAENTAFYGGQNPPKGEQLPYVPQHALNASAALAWRHWELRYLQSFYGRYYLNASNRSYMPAFPLSHLALSKRWPLGPGWQLLSSISVRNLMDIDYQILPYRPEPGRHFWLRLELRWRENPSRG
jgi:Outer membrane receptor proteins, mostly Fe transport